MLNKMSFSWQVLASGGRPPSADRVQQPGRGVGRRLRPHSLGVHWGIWRWLHPRYSFRVRHRIIRILEFKM